MKLKYKILLLIVAGLIALNIFLPDRAQEAVERISETIGVSEEKIKKGVDLATEITKDSVKALHEKTQEALED